MNALELAQRLLHAITGALLRWDRRLHARPEYSRGVAGLFRAHHLREATYLRPTRRPF